MAKPTVNEAAARNLQRAKGTVLTTLRHCAEPQRSLLLQALDQIDTAILRTEQQRPGEKGRADELCVIATRLLEHARDTRSASRTQRSQLTIASRHLLAARQAFESEGAISKPKSWLW